MIFDQVKKKELAERLGANLSALRAKVKISQDDLAQKLGITRQTITAIEKNKRVMQWNTFVLLTLFFSQNQEVKSLMQSMSIYTKELQDFLRI